MRPDKRRNTNIGVGIGALLQLAGLPLIGSADTAGYGLMLILVGTPLLIWGCMNYAEGKGHSKWVGLVGLAGIIGLIVLVLLPDQDGDGSADRLQPPKVAGLIALVAGFGLALLGLWLHDLGEDARLERMLHPWPYVCMFAGFCIAIAGTLDLSK